MKLTQIRLRFNVVNPYNGAVHFGVYADEDGNPGGLIADIGSVDLGATGVKDLVIDDKRAIRSLCRNGRLPWAPRAPAPFLAWRLSGDHQPMSFYRVEVNRHGVIDLPVAALGSITWLHHMGVWG